MLQQLKFITDNTNPYFNFYFRLLESLSTVKSVVLIFELPEGSQLMTGFFQLVFTQIASSTLSEACRLYALELLQTLLEECDVIPNEVIDLIWSCFEKESNSNDQALILATGLLKMTHQKLGPVFGLKFEQTHYSSQAKKNIHKTETAVRNIFSASVEAAASILLILGTRLKLEDESMKCHAIKFLGVLFTEYFTRNRDLLMPETLCLIWNNWLSRRNDNTAEARLAWISTINMMLEKTPSIILMPDISSSLGEKLCDPESKIREHAVMALNACDPMIVPDSLLIEIVNRARDKNASVRAKALECIKKTLSTMLISMHPHGTGEYGKRFSHFINEIFCLLYTNEPELR